MWFPIMVFAATGFEHSIANMAYIPLGLMYGADADYKKWLYQNLLLVILGNIVGGGIVVGGAEYFLFDWTRLRVLSPAENRQHLDARHYHPHPNGHHPHPHEEHSDGTSSHSSTHRDDPEPESRHGRYPCGAACAACGGGTARGLDAARVREVFGAFDSDGDGALDAQELACALHALGFNHPFALLRAVACARAGAAGEAERFDLAALEAQARIVSELEALGLSSSPAPAQPATLTS
jgi:hypothetical protein